MAQNLLSDKCCAINPTGLGKPEFVKVNFLDTLTTGPRDARAQVVLAHGAGAPMTSPFMDTFARLLGERNIGVIRFNFPYMAAFQEDGRRRPPPNVNHLATFYRDLVQDVVSKHAFRSPLFIGGKSMGGRVATMIGDEAYLAKACRGVICLGYPFHPKGKPDKLRTAHLETLRASTLIVQGERDALGNHREVSGYALAPSITCAWITDGDHDFKPRKASGVSAGDNMRAAADIVADWISKSV